MKSLKDEIDKPLLKTVALINLLGVKTYWSCCGFNYEDQPEGKSHDYGTVQIFMEKSPRGLQLATTILDAGLPFKIEATRCAGTDAPVLAITRPFAQPVVAWNKPESAHYHEMPAQYIQYLENFLQSPNLVKMMVDETILIDTNEFVRTKFPYWSAKPGIEWTIKKSDFVTP